jgi:hypothetical protein
MVDLLASTGFAAGEKEDEKRKNILSRSNFDEEGKPVEGATVGVLALYRDGRRIGHQIPFPRVTSVDECVTILGGYHPRSIGWSKRFQLLVRARLRKIGT